MTRTLPNRMVNVMPNQNPTPALRQAPRAAIAVLAAAFLLLCVSGTAQAALQGAAADDSSFISSPYTVTIILVLLLVGLIVYKKRSAHGKWSDVTAEPVKSPTPTVRAEPPPLTNASVRSEPATLAERRAAPRTPVIEGAQVWEKPHPVEAEPSVYVAYRVDQEVGKLVLGKPHRMDVMASRASEDRRAIEASLVKALDSSDITEEGRHRAQ